MELLNVLKKKILKIYSHLNNIKNFLKLTFNLIIKLFKTKNIKGGTKKLKRVNIYVNDWLTSGLFSFNIYLGLVLNNEFRVVFLFDKFNLYNNLQSLLVNFLCELVLKVVKKKFGINYIILGMSNKRHVKSSDRYDIINKLFQFNMMRYERDVSYKIVKNKNYFIKKNLAENIYNHIEALIVSKEISSKDINFISGGYLNCSYVLNRLFRKYKINFYSYDSENYKKGYSICYCKNGIAGLMEESGLAYKNLKVQNYFNPSKFKKIKKIVLKEIIKKKKNKSGLNYYQVSSKNNLKYKNFAMITINSGWDANSLDTSHIFKNYLAFLKETSLFFKKNFPKINLLIKNHPHRKQGIIKENDSVEKLSKSISKQNVVFIDSDEANFYDLIKDCKILISVSSTTINEALIMNIPAVSAGKDQYYHFKLGINSNSKKEYFREIKNILMRKRFKKIDQNKIFAFYYLIHIKKFLPTEFNPQTTDWFKYDIKDLYKTNHVKLVKKMIKTNKTYLESKLN